MYYIFTFSIVGLMTLLLSFGFQIGERENENKKVHVISTGTGYLVDLEKDPSIPFFKPL